MLSLAMSYVAAANTGNGFSLTADAVVDEARLTGNLLHDCVNGAGMMTVLSARTGLACELDLLRAVR